MEIYIYFFKYGLIFLFYLIKNIFTWNSLTFSFLSAQTHKKIIQTTTTTNTIVDMVLVYFFIIKGIYKWEDFFSLNNAGKIRHLAITNYGIVESSNLARQSQDPPETCYALDDNKYVDNTSLGMILYNICLT